MTALSRALVIVGGVLFGTAATLGLALFGAGSWLSRAPLALGIVLLLAGAAMGRRGSTAWRVRPALDVVVIAVAVVALNVVAGGAEATWDVTTSRRNTLAEVSIQTARALERDVVILAHLDGQDRAWVELEQLVQAFSRHTSRIRLERASTAEQPTPSRDAGAAVVVRCGDRVRRLPFEAGAPDHEAELVAALRAVTSESAPRVYATSGHGEAELSDEGIAGLTRLKRALVAEGFEVVPLPLAAVGRVPDDARAVVVAGPRTPFSPAEADVLARWQDAGGRLLVLLEPRADAGLAGLLGAVGIQANDDVVVDASAFAGLLGGRETATGVAYAAHPTTRRLGSAMTHFPGARSLAVNPGPAAVPLELVKTGVEAYGETAREGPAAEARDDADIGGPMVLGLVVEDGPRRLAVVGDATFASNVGLGLGVNKDLALNLLLWLAEREDQIAVRPRGRGGNLLLLTPSARERLAFFLLYGMPILLVGAGLTVSALRRHRRS